ncbi:plasmid mobilization relaxosome protein MobC [Pseudomonas sp. MH9.2]|uniref:plasmid mobilization relaxosome protein MobC n=1 Tax=Pseudomonas sp. MH9.2 TaxID=3048629 RepID=UPI002AC971B5|nr:plasmid mobilization relaxosome protein MobC [Pseudomonas sp. MH9.2]MEB0025894.1 plasmid mobilization relaxosome protein MobC [Pseudomonas sp. MH9.2]WPX71339.1 plasmid mobilization relaxosome protein MobC [Pseudomonas sp. MH9.2]
MSNKTATLITRIGQCDKNQFERIAKSHNLTPSELLRRLVLTEIGKNETFKAVGPEPQKIGTTRLTIRLAEFLMDSVKLRAESKGMATGRWVSALVQSHVSNAPVVTEKEVLVLRAISRELSAIGRNINQIARHLNSPQNHNGHIDLGALSKLPTSIENAKQNIRTVIKATWQGWGVVD